MKPKVTIVIATYNSEKTLPLVIGSLKKQSYPESRIEILLIDGGSIDNTLAIGKKYKCLVKNNPRTEPVYAKYLGYLNARGKYIMFLDHDEVIKNKRDVELKVKILESDNKIKMVVGSGYKNPSGYPFINDYINDFGDPFSFYMDRLSRNSSFFVKTMKRRYEIVKENKDFTVFDFSRDKVFPPFELVQGGSMLDLSFLKRQFPEVAKKYELSPHIFFLLCSKDPYLAVVKNSPLIHYSAETLGKYIKKINWRIKNNTYHIQSLGQAGFSGKEKYQPKWRRVKKYMFLLYAYSILFPLSDSIYLGVTRKNAAYLFHLPLTIYAATAILFHHFMRLIKQKPSLKNYDGSKVVESR